MLINNILQIFLNYPNNFLKNYQPNLLLAIITNVLKVNAEYINNYLIYKQIYTKLITIFEKDPQNLAKIYLTFAEIYLQTGKTDKALKNLNKCIKDKNYNAKILSHVYLW